ncbi:hypothetical protein Dda_0657 [Drechslerella dactyloides]|uniref:Uncharacterized protein n=1 Tax=Drechslerella dactyloides TaxID=74499 RepID=A0AAD6J6U8_DREDA|nr:hypothetical protein Dda_0657 [Drechslerella dactyloides]
MMSASQPPPPPPPGGGGYKRETADEYQSDPEENPESTSRTNSQKRRSYYEGNQVAQRKLRRAARSSIKQHLGDDVEEKKVAWQTSPRPVKGNQNPDEMYHWIPNPASERNWNQADSQDEYVRAYQDTLKRRGGQQSASRWGRNNMNTVADLMESGDILPVRSYPRSGGGAPLSSPYTPASSSSQAASTYTTAPAAPVQGSWLPMPANTYATAQYVPANMTPPPQATFYTNQLAPPAPSNYNSPTTGGQYSNIPGAQQQGRPARLDYNQQPERDSRTSFNVWGIAPPQYGTPPPLPGITYPPDSYQGPGAIRSYQQSQDPGPDSPGPYQTNDQDDSGGYGYQNYNNYQGGNHQGGDGSGWGSGVA